MAAALVSRGVPYTDILSMGASQIADLCDSLDKAHWSDEIARARLTHVASQGTSKDLEKTIKPVLKAISGPPKEDNANQTAALLRDLGGGR